MLFSAALRAADADPAQATFDRGVADMEAGRFEQACPAIEESYKLDPRLGTLFTLAECEAGRGRLATALKRYRDYLAFWAALPNDKRQKQGDRAETARRQQAVLLPQVPLMTLALPPSAPNTTLVIRDGEGVPAAALGVPSPVDPGQHVITTQAPGGPVSEVRITVAKGEKKSVVLEVRVAEVSRPVLAEPLVASGGSVETKGEASSGGSQRLAGFVVGGVGVAGLAVGAITGIVALVKHGEFRSMCPADNMMCTSDPGATVSTGKAFSTASTVAFAVGLAGAVVGTTLVLSSGVLKKTASAGLMVLPGGGGVTARVGF